MSPNYIKTKIFLKIAVAKTNTHLYMYLYTYYIISPDLFLIHTGSHARAYTKTFIRHKCRVLKGHCDDCCLRNSCIPSDTNNSYF